MPSANTRSTTKREKQALASDEEGSTNGGMEDKETDQDRLAPATRKRGREGSTEPSAAAGVSTISGLTGIAIKKNRIEEPKTISATSSISEEATDNDIIIGEGSAVGAVRKKVEELSHMDENQAKKDLGTVDEETVEDGSDKGSIISKMDSVEESVMDAEGSAETGRKRKLLARAASANAIGPDVAKRIKEDVTKTMSTDETELTIAETPTVPQAVATPVKKPQATFGSFSSTASPFATAKSSTQALGESSSSTSLSSDIAAKVRAANGLPGTTSETQSTPPPPVKKPQASFGSFSAAASPFSAIQHKSAFASSSIPSSTSQASSLLKNATSSSSAFGGWSSAAVSSPFSTPAKKVATPDSTKEEQEEEVASESKAEPTFGDILAKSGTGPEIETKKVDLEQQDLGTGEEDEDTVFQARVKLFYIDKDNKEKGWRERGQGSLRVNVGRSDSKTPRLVMRSEGVHRLILNSVMFPAMAFTLSDKCVRTVVYEDGLHTPLLFRTPSVKAAEELLSKLETYVPLKEGEEEVEGDEHV